MRLEDRLKGSQIIVQARYEHSIWGEVNPRALQEEGKVEAVRLNEVMIRGKPRSTLNASQNRMISD